MKILFYIWSFHIKMYSKHAGWRRGHEVKILALQSESKENRDLDVRLYSSRQLLSQGEWTEKGEKAPMAERKPERVWCGTPEEDVLQWRMGQPDAAKKV
jgi:hypothetical protein